MSNSQRWISAVLLLTLLTVAAPLSGLAKNFPRQSFGTLDLELVRNQTNQNDTVFTKTVREALQAKDWNKLEQFGKAADNDKEYSYKGYNSWSTFISEMEACSNDYEGRLKVVGQWMAAKPQSAIAPAVYGQLMACYAWQARGSGWSDSVSAEGWRLFGQRLATARKVLETSHSKGIKRTKGWYEAMQTIALGQSWERKEYDLLFADATTDYPKHSPFYFHKAYWLLPRWHGDEGEWLAFISKTADKIGGDEGDLLYARSMWYIGGIGEEEIAQSSMPRIISGFNALNRIFRARPDATIASKSAIAELALMKGDKKLARNLFDEMGNKVSMYVWSSKHTFVEEREKAYID